MALRQRKERTQPTGSEELQLWHGVRGHLRSLERLRVAALEKSTAAEQLRAELVSSKERTDDSRMKKRKLDEFYSDLRQKTMDEQKSIDQALEKLGILTALRNSGDGGHAGSLSGITTPSSRSKRLEDDRLMASSGKIKSSLTGRRSHSTNTPLSGSGSSKETSSSVYGGSLSQNSSSLSSDPARARREALAHQLPLQKGRKVAFRQPPKKNSSTLASNGSSSGGGNSGTSGTIHSHLHMEEDGETWIMATIIECINNDKNRYVVQDAEEEGDSGPTWNTTLKAIVPLAESVHTLPPQGYPIDSQVLALYPDTSCFYKATIKGGGPGITRTTPMSKLVKKEQELLNANYLVEFEDDGGEVRSVPAYLVVERPRS